MALVLLLARNGFSAGSQEQLSPALATTRAFVERALGILKNPADTLAAERRELRDLAAPHFAFADMARSSLGYHWRELSPGQRAGFVGLFTAFVEDVYLDKIQAYSGQDIHFIRVSSLGSGYAEVYSRVVQSGADPIPLNFMLEQSDGRWLIYDVEVDGISMVGNYRSQFSRVIDNDGFNELVARLKGKEIQLTGLLGKP